MNFRIFHSLQLRLALVAYSLFLAISTITRLGLCVAARNDIDWGWPLLRSFAAGLGFDAATAVFATIPWLFFSALSPARFPRSRTGRILIFTGMSIFTSLLVFIATAEWFFWDEFGARFNFIAVDYLIWTQEVWGNINESYPMALVVTGILAVSTLVVYGLSRLGTLRWAAEGSSSPASRVGCPVGALAAALLIVQFVSQSRLPVFANQFNGELAKNGPWSFFTAFRQMEIDYDTWYPRLPRKEMLWSAKELLATPEAPFLTQSLDDLRRSIVRSTPEKRLNLILVCMESMSGDFMGHFGNKRGLTPNLDRLAEESLCFENLYATGTRTVRGMEALTLGLPPTPGQSILYRPDGVDLATSMSPFLDRGYDCAFLYGGDGRFDFMNRYFSTSGARIVDSGAWRKEDITMKTSWGACDEDLFRKTIAEADADYAAGRPFHFFCMTTSNHRPYDFPGGRIDLPAGSRRAAVKYADWAVGQLISESKKHAWFKDTLFVIVSDHCASSAGKMEIDVTKYHIPALIYNPGIVPAAKVDKLCSQIDIMPTVMGILSWNYQTLGFGRDLLSSSASAAPGRAFVSNYQKIALLEEGSIAILKPGRIEEAFSCDRTNGNLSSIDAEKASGLTHRTKASYQSAAWLFGTGKLKHPGHQPAFARN